MTVRDLNRILLVPALIVLGSLTVTSCVFFPSDDSSTSSRDRDDRDEDEEEEEVEEESTTACPPDFVAALERLQPDDFGGEYTVLEPTDFGAPEIGENVLVEGCLFRAEVTVDGVDTSTDFGYLPGDEATVTEIGTTLVTAGYTVAGYTGSYTHPDGTMVLVTQADNSAEPSLDDLGLDFGDTFVVVMVTTAPV